MLTFIGGRTADEIVNWLKKKTGPVATTLTTVEATKEAIEKNDVYVVGFFANVESDEGKAFLAAASEIDDIPFAISSESAIATEYKVEGNAVVLFKKVHICIFVVYLFFKNHEYNCNLIFYSKVR